MMSAILDDSDIKLQKLEGLCTQRPQNYIQ